MPLGRTFSPPVQRTPRRAVEGRVQSACAASGVAAVPVFRLIEPEFAQGGLQLASYARPAKLFTAHASLIRSVAGALNDPAHQRVLDAVLSLLREGAARS